MKINNDTLKPYIYPFCLALLQCLQLQISSIQLQGIASFIYIKVYLSVVLLMCIDLLLSHCKTKKPLYAFSILITLFSIANYFTFKYHQKPLFLSVMRNAGTAFTVAKGYSFAPDIWMLLIPILLAVQIFVIRKISKTSIKPALALSAITVILMGISFQSNPYAALPAFCIEHEGFPIAFVRDAVAKRNVIKPENYKVYESKAMTAGANTPDIILILNESYSTINEQSKLENIPGMITGKVVVPEVGGGTNDSEYELLTSNSVKLMPAEAPFTYLSEESLSTNTAADLKILGYETTAMHCFTPQNYNRDEAYKYMGFDHIYLGPEYFTINSYGERLVLDSDNYNDMLKLCRFDGCPKFVYLLTYQNHGGYNQNDPSFDTVHAKGYGKYNDEMSEFLTSVDMSEDAFIELTEHFKDSDRPTIICMIGDHNPPFISEIESDTVKQRQTNYVIWSNYDLDIEDGDLTLTDALPLILKSADISRTDFVETVCELHDQYPIHTKDDVLIDKEGSRTKYSGQDILTEYYSKEYDRISGQ